MKVRTVNPEISIMSQSSSKSEPYWSPSFPSSTNLGFNVHNYYFAYRLTESDTDSSVVCNDAKLSAVGGKVPVFVGGWSIQTASDSKFANRENNLNTGLFAFGKCTQSSAYWIAKLSGDMKVDGEGVQGDYWDWGTFVDLGYVNAREGARCCARESVRSDGGRREREKYN